MQATVEYDLALQPFKRPQDEEYLKVNLVTTILTSCKNILEKKLTAFWKTQGWIFCHIQWFVLSYRNIQLWVFVCHWRALLSWHILLSSCSNQNGEPSSIIYSVHASSPAAAHIPYLSPPRTYAAIVWPMDATQYTFFVAFAWSLA